MRPRWLLVGAAGIVVLALFVLRSWEGPRTRPHTPSIGDAPEEPAPRAGVAAAGEDAPNAAGEGLGDRQADGVGTRAAVQVVVLDQGSRTPVADAEVSACDFDLLMARIQGQQVEAGATLDHEARAAIRTALSTVRRTGGDGQARVPILGSRMLIDAKADGRLYGRWIGQPPTGPVEILVAVDRTLRVKVMSSAQQPAFGVPIELRRRAGASQVRDSVAPDGIATFIHVQSMFEEHDDWRVGFGFPLARPAEIPVSRASIPAEPLVLVLPATGSLRIELADEHERPVDGAQVELQVAAFDDAERVQEVPQGRWSMPRADVAGVALVPHLGLGFFLRVTATARDGESRHRPVVVDLSGPDHAGEVVACKVPWPSAADPRGSYPIAVGRFVRSDGRPWPAAEVEAWPRIFPLPPQHLGSRKVRVAKDGHFELLLADACPPDGKRVYHLTCREPSELAGIEGRLDLSRAFPPGETDLGDIVLDNGALLAGGTVVDSQGAALPGAVVQLSQLVEGTGRELWPNVDCAGSNKPSATGAFALRATWGQEPPRSRLRLRVRCPGFSARDVDVRLGERDLVVVLERAGSLAGTVSLGPGQRGDDIAILLLRGEEGIATPSLRDDGSFEQDGLAPGPLRLVAWLRTGAVADRRASRVVVDDLVIVAGETNRDPRIQGLSVRGTAATMTVRVTDRAGGPIERAAVEAAGSTCVLSDTAGVAVLRPARLPTDVRISAFGYRDAQLTDVSGDREVVLEPALRIRLVTDAKPQGRDPDYQLGFFLYHTDSEGRQGAMVYGLYGRSFPYERMNFDSNGQASVPIPGPGCYEVVPRVYVGGKDGVGRGGTVRIQPAPRITVLETAAVQTFQVAIPQTVLDAAAREYDK